MNKHFEDAWYYLGRTLYHLRIGLTEELEPVEAAMRNRFGWDEADDDEPRTRLDRVKTEFQKVDTEPVRKARERIGEYRGRPPAE